MIAELGAELVESYRRDGFLIIERLIDADDVATIRAAYDELITDEGRATGDRLLGGITRQVMRPSEAHPVFRDNAALEVGKRIGRQLLGQPVEPLFDMLIYKPPGHPHETPWHQDMAYTEQPAAPAGTFIPLGGYMQFWVALDDVDPENGCMHFVPGQHHHPLLHHVVVSGDPADPGRLLALPNPAEQLDLAKAVAAPLSAGGCTIHSYGTPHYTPANRSDTRARPAYIFNLVPPQAVDA